MKKIHVGYHSPPFSWKHSLRKKKSMLMWAMKTEFQMRQIAVSALRCSVLSLRAWPLRLALRQPSTCVGIPFVPQPPCCCMYRVLMHAGHYYCHPISETDCCSKVQTSSSLVPSTFGLVLILIFLKNSLMEEEVSLIHWPNEIKSCINFRLLQIIIRIELVKHK